MADINAPFEQNVFNLAKRKLIANVHHHRKADDFGRTIEAAERISHPRKLWMDTHWLKSDCYDNAQPGLQIGSAFRYHGRQTRLESGGSGDRSEHWQSYVSGDIIESHFDGHVDGDCFRIAVNNVRHHARALR